MATLHSNYLLSTLFLSLLLVSLVQSTHFRFGTISWMPVSRAKYNTIEFSVELGFRTDYVNFMTVQVGQPIVGYNNDNYTGTDIGTLYFGQDDDYEQPVCVVNSKNDQDNWFTCTATVYYTYPTQSASYDVHFEGFARLRSLLNNANSSYSISSSVHIAPPTANGLVQQSVVGSTLPIITMTKGVNNSFQMVAYNSDPSRTLHFRLATPTEMGSSKLTQPVGLTVSTTGILSFVPPTEGLYSTQVIISNGYDYVAVDFIISADNNVNVPFFIDPTPHNEDIIKCAPDVPVTWTYKAASNLTNAIVTIFDANLPVGVTSTTSGANPTTVISNWTPNFRQIGSYVVSIGAKDQRGVYSTSQTSFILLVESPPCGHGQLKPSCNVNSNPQGCCTCQTGFDPSTNCFECLPGHFGDSCALDPVCIHGQVNSGSLGDGTCVCDYGYTGVTCDKPLNDYCNSAEGSSVYQSSKNGGFLTPYDIDVYVAPTGPAFAVPIKLLANPTPNLLDIYVVLDITPTNEFRRADYQQNIGSFIYRLQNYNANVNFGLGFFSDLGFYSFDFQHVLPIGSPIAPYFQSKQTYNSLYVNSTMNSLKALNAAASTGLGWRRGAYRLVLILTDHDCDTFTSSFANEVHNNLVNNFIMPVVQSVGGAPLDNWNQFLSSNKFGLSDISNKSGADWSGKALNSIFNSFSTATPFIVGDTRGFVPNTALPTFTVAANGTYDLPLQVKYPSSSVASITNVNFLVNVPGYGQTNVNLEFNHVPTATSVSLTASTTQATTFTLPISDPDNNKMTVRFPTLPTKGTLRLSDTNAQVTSTTATYPSSQSFSFQGTTGGVTDTLTYAVSDGCSEATATITITIQATVDPRPQAYPSTIGVLAGEAYTFTVNYTSIMSNGQVYVKFQSIPEYGELSYMLFGTKRVITGVNDGSSIPPTLTYEPSISGVGITDTFTFSVVTPQGLESQTTATVSLIIIDRPRDTYAPNINVNTTTNYPIYFGIPAVILYSNELTEKIVMTSSGRGQLYGVTCMEPGCLVQLDPRVESYTAKSNGQYQFLYVPEVNTSGDGLMYIQYTAMGRTGTLNGRVYINVKYVPQLHPTKFLWYSIITDAMRADNITNPNRQSYMNPVLSDIPADGTLTLPKNSVAILYFGYPSFNQYGLVNSVGGRGQFLLNRKYFNQPVTGRTPLRLNSDQDFYRNGQATSSLVFVAGSGETGYGYARLTGSAIINPDGGAVEYTSNPASLVINVVEELIKPSITYNPDFTSTDGVVRLNQVIYSIVDPSAENTNVTMAFTLLDNDGVVVSNSIFQVYDQCRRDYTSDKLAATQDIVDNNSTYVMIGTPAQLYTQFNQCSIGFTLPSNQFYTLLVVLNNTALTTHPLANSTNLASTTTVPIKFPSQQWQDQVNHNNPYVIPATVAAVAVVVAAIIAVLYAKFSAAAAPTSSFFGQ
ncbi:hypothetical protein SAMD00019534_069250 [Acytostelium subglobosum LB1]|uniref:hypothetical protein n=1 Tax=Acytostelium subglobosum LB1 TaxID=1410327 RepID=UPI0006449271|nr:hypothetical protein SAMD00019534_069250 [Acytostelium subglobosum LB1]GAM23750.1 hypothetical protein SAMD00019534_069250 [Acytostelium subglobosum LB1]|eukprot:XP_012753491.1 hypothetical protein SAMD00019534_069250 [Acytostelium subglobosum LB1]